MPKHVIERDLVGAGQPRTDEPSGWTGSSDEEMQMTHASEEIVRKAYRAFGEGDMDTLRSLYAPDAVHRATGNNPVSGDYSGVDAILGYFGTLFERSDGTFTAELNTVNVDGDDTVIATHRDRAQRGDKSLDQDDTLTFTIARGKITRIVEHHADPAAYDAFWS